MSYLTEAARNLLSARVGRALLDERPDDVVVAAAPRSGSTWFRTMLAHLLWPDLPLRPELYNSRIPAVSIRNAPLIRRLPSPRLVMTHGAWYPSVPKAIYVVRDGRDSIVSLYHYLITRAGRQMEFREFFEWYRWRRFGLRWDEHVRSWLIEGARSLGDDLLIIRFERLRDCPVDVMRRACQFLDIVADDAGLVRAVELSSTENMKRIETEESGRVLRGDASFYRGGRVSQWRDYFDEQQLHVFRLLGADVIDLLDMKGL